MYEFFVCQNKTCPYFGQPKCLADTFKVHMDMLVLNLKIFILIMEQIAYFQYD